MQLNLFTKFCKELRQAFDMICNEFDHTWQNRKRILNTQLLVMCICKLVLSKNKQGYTSTLIHLWESCLDKGIELPQLIAVSPSSLCEARQKLSEDIFIQLNGTLLEHWHNYQSCPMWYGHRIFAIDGTRIHIPRELITAGYTLNNDQTFYPQGLISCLYNLQEKLVYDCILSADFDERKYASKHIASLRSNDIIIFDRGYFSYWLLYELVQNNIHGIFRMQKGNSNKDILEFWNSDRDDIVINYTPSLHTINSLRSRNFCVENKTILLRLIKRFINSEVHVYATTLIDNLYDKSFFSDLYCERWNIEELYKISKEYIEIEQFHSKTERGIKQEVYSHVLLINLSRVFSINAQDLLPTPNQTITSRANNDTKYCNEMLLSICNKISINFKNSILVLGRHLENLLIAQKEVVGSYIRYILESIARVRQKFRPNRSYLRISHVPKNKWVKAKLSKPELEFIIN